MSENLSTEFDFPPEFPVTAYKAVTRAASRFSGKRGAPPIAWREWAASWNGLHYRFRACQEHNEGFIEALDAGDLYEKDKEFFGFFVTGLSAIECFCCGSYALGSIAKSTEFHIDTNTYRKKMTIKTTAQKFQENFPGARISSRLQSLWSGAPLREWRDIRNVMAHRQKPPITMTLNLTVGSRPNFKSQVQTRATIDSSSDKGPLQIEINNQTTENRWQWLVGVLTELIEAAADFTGSEFQ